MIINICNKCHNVIVGADVLRATNLCNCKSDYFECDEDIYPMLQTLWDKKYITKFSCSGHTVTNYFINDNEAIKRPDFNAYIAIDGPSVKVKDFIKYKYGYAAIYIHDPSMLYIDEMKTYGIELDDNYDLSSSDKIFIDFISKFHPDEKDDILSWIDSAKFTYNIRPTYEFMDKFGSFDKPGLSRIENYMPLLELRHDMAKLIQLLPYNR